jgi:hypothetical protein
MAWSSPRWHPVSSRHPCRSLLDPGIASLPLIQGSPRRSSRSPEAPPSQQARSSRSSGQSRRRKLVAVRLNVILILCLGANSSASRAAANARRLLAVHLEKARLQEARALGHSLRDHPTVLWYPRHHQLWCIALCRSWLWSNCSTANRCRLDHCRPCRIYSHDARGGQGARQTADSPLWSDCGRRWVERSSSLCRPSATSSP